MHGEMLVSSYRSSLLLADSNQAWRYVSLQLQVVPSTCRQLSCMVRCYSPVIGRPFYLQTAIKHGDMSAYSYRSSLLLADSYHAW